MPRVPAMIQNFHHCRQAIGVFPFTVATQILLLTLAGQFHKDNAECMQMT